MIYQCLYCPFSTERKYNLKVHEERKHRRNIEFKEEVNEELDEESSVSDLKDMKAHRDISILDVDMSRNGEKRSFSDIATDLNDTIIFLEGLKDEYLEALPQLRKLKGCDLKTALNDYAVLKANVALVTTGLEEDSGRKVETTDNVSDEEDTDSSSSDPDERDASTDDNSSDEESSKSSMQDDDEKEDVEDADTDTEEEEKNSGDVTDDESSKSSMQDDDEEEDAEDTDTYTEEEGKNSIDVTDDENEENLEVDNVEQSKGDYWDFVQEAEHFVKQRDKKLMEKLIRKMNGYYAAMYEHDSKYLESMKQVYKDIRKVKSQVRQGGVGYLSLCSKRKIASMCLSAKLLKDIFDEKETAFKSICPNHFRRFIKRVGYNAEKLNDPNISTHMKRRLLQKGDICRGILDGMLEFLIPFMKK